MEKLFFSTKKALILENGGGITKFLGMMGKHGLRKLNYRQDFLGQLKINRWNYPMENYSILAVLKSIIVGPRTLKYPIQTLLVGKK